MPKHHLTQKPSRFILYPLVFLLSFLLCFPWVNAKEAPKPKPQEWQINGIVAALDDGHDDVKGYALRQLGEYDSKDIKAVVKKPEDIVEKIANILKDEKVDSRVRRGAAQALGNFGEPAAKYIPDIANILKDEKVNVNLRSGAAEALGNFGEPAAKYIPDIANILKDEKVNVNLRSGAAVALGNFGEPAAKYIPDILNILKDEKVDSRVRRGAAEALGKFGEVAAKYIPDIANILKDEKVDFYARSRAAEALGNFGEPAAKYIPDILNILKDEKVDFYARSGAAQALGNFGEPAAKYIPDIFKILKDEKVNSFVRGSAAMALGNFGEPAAKYIPDILNFLKDEKVYSNVRSGAAQALGNFGEPAAKYIPDIANILKDKKVDSNVRSGAAEALGNFGESAAKYIPDIVNILKDEKVNSSVRSGAAEALGKIKQLELKQVVVVLNNLYDRSHNEFKKWRFLTYFTGGGNKEVKTLLTWLGSPNPETIPKQLKHNEAVKTLKVFKTAWESSQGLTYLRNDLAQQIAMIVAYKNVTWQPQDIALLQSHYNNLKAVNSPNADAVQSVIVNLQGWQWLFKARNTIIIHALFWLALIFAYPKYPQIQAIFFWNPWVRKIIGMGYVGFLLTWVPFLRRKLLEPFQPSLLADAGLDNFDDNAYFPQSHVTQTRNYPSSNPSLPVTQAIPAIKGQIVLEGDSGLGKSMFLRHLLKASQQIIVYLPARKCENGVIAAIQAKLHGQAQDASFLKNLIYSGAIDICIDGLNEVTADTRAKVTQFVESYFRGNIIMTTQPLEWISPSTAKTYYIQPLQPTQIEQFLLSRQPHLPPDGKIQGTAYQRACKTYLTKTLHPQQPPEELAAAKRVLSNPMDLTLVALMLSQGEHPDLFHLQQQQYNHMAAEYLQEWKHEFPLKTFSQAVYQMRLNDESALPAEEFYQELESMEDEKYKMVVSCQWKENGDDKKEWFFRHDKIMDFFLVQNFLGDGTEAEKRLIDHMGDPRFRGVYFLLAILLPLDAARELREKLIQYAADTKDHTVSDTFVQLLRPR
ncbi:MAG: HEAT repeat domain-containing protein [Calothrix sp. MO_192.B10]|nr:HEAT repeat domain-containing protein [Calothrix sp. MO_192.B10]